LSNYRNIAGIDWQDEIFKNSPVQIHNIAIRGGDKDTKYSISGSLFDQNGIIINSGAKRYQGRAALDQTISKKIKVGLTINYGYYGKNGYAINGEDVSNSTNYGIFRAWGARPVSGESNLNLMDYAIDPDYSLTSPFPKYNPVTSLENEDKELGSSNLLTSAYFEWDILKNLKFRSIGSVNTDRDRLDIFYNSLTPGGNTALVSNGSFRYLKSRYFTNENTLNYTNVFNGVHALDATAGFSYYNGMRELFGFSVSNLPNEDIGKYGLDEGLPYVTESNMSKYSFRSYFGRLNYNFKSKYYLSASLRAEELPFTNNTFSFSPSVSLAWNMMGEDFLKSSNIVSTSKLRLGYGQIQSWLYEPYNYLSVFGANDAIFNGLLDLNNRRETTEQYNLGYDLGLLKDKVALSLDVYRKDAGSENPYLASVRNEGLEVSLSTNNIQTDKFKWTSHFNIAFNKSKILSINNTDAIYSQMGVNSPSSPLYVSKVGSPVGMFYGYVFDGIYQVESFDYVNGAYTLKVGVPDNGSPRTDIQPGHIRYKDLDHNGIINEDDQTIIGRSAPKHFGGFLNNFNYKAFDLSVLFQWSYGNQIYNANRMLFEGNYLNLMGLNQYASYNDRWTEENRSNELFKVGGQGPAGMESSRVLEDGSYLRLKTISVGYSIPKRHIKSLYLSQLNVRLSAQNLFTITKYSGLDPEVSSRHSVLTPGFDYAAYPQARTISLGLHATF
ncbi:SusC/RagA family TonB-linked outer membrane protein, partial [Pseudopedobacter sp.]|uniref:SusC/RagA family TonB-linked outer membrane protein n=1 Tax=Pseudopedobacter sp. TaxID=1936787 RepID=UPI00333EA4E1